MPKSKRGEPSRLVQPFGLRMMNPEWKTCQTISSNTPAANTPVAQNVVLSIAQGVGYNQRVGDGIVIHELEVVCKITDTGVAAAGAFLVQPVICVDADTPASDMTLSGTPLSSLDRHVVNPLGAAWRQHMSQAANGLPFAGAAGAVHTWTLRGRWPVRWDRTGDPTGPQIFLYFTTGVATQTFEVTTTVTYTDA